MCHLNCNSCIWSLQPSCGPMHLSLLMWRNKYIEGSSNGSLCLTHSTCAWLNSICLSVCVQRPLLSLCSSIFLFGSPDSCWKSHTNQLTAITLFTTREGEKRANKHQLLSVMRRAVIMCWCFLGSCDPVRHAQSKQEDQQSCVHQEDTSINVK